MDTISRVLAATAFAVRKHEGQYRKSAAGERVPYVTHPMRVAALVASAGGSPDAIVAAVLHDTLEDTSTTMGELIEEFGFEVAFLVGEVTDDMSLPKNKRKEVQAKKAPYMSAGAKLIKLADKLDNVRSIVASPPAWSNESKIGYAESAARVVEALGDVSAALRADFVVAMMTLKASVATC
jgi:guanosine-3',5'-bis(diphosphate) 3'-pyrophosphohydrolase